MRKNRCPASYLAVLLLLACGGGEGSLAESGVVRAPDGVPIHYTVEGSGAPALVFVHGWSCDASYWNAQTARFARSHRVVAIDLAGHGRSGEAREQWSIRAFGADVVAVLAELEIRDAVLIGHSMGGPVIVEAALAAPNRVRGLVGVDNFQTLRWEVTDEVIEGWLAGYRTDFAGTAEKFVGGMFPEDADSALVRRIVKDMASAPPEAGIGALEATFSWWREESNERVRGLSVPLRCINSDAVPTDSAALAAAVPGYHLDEMPGRGHFLMIEDPEGFNELLAKSIAAFDDPPRRAGEAGGAPID